MTEERLTHREGYLYQFAERRAGTEVELEPLTIGGIFAGAYALGAGTIDFFRKKTEANRDQKVAESHERIELSRSQVNELRECTRHISDLYTKINDQFDMINKLRAQNDAKDEKIDQLETKNRDLTETVRDMQAKSVAKDKKIEDLQIELADTKIALDGALHTAAMLQGQVDELSKRVDEGMKGTS